MRPIPPPPFRDVYLRGVNHVWATLRACGVPERHLADATQEVFIIVLKLLPSYEPREDTPLNAWLGAIARRVAANARRAERARPIMAEDVSADLADSTRTDEDTAALVLALHLLDELSEDARKVFLMHEVEGQPIPDVARALGIPEGTAYSRLRQARRELAAARQRREASIAAILPVVVAAGDEATAPGPPIPPDVRDRILERIMATPEYAEYEKLQARNKAEPPARPQAPRALPLEPGALAGMAVGAVVVGFLLGAVVDPFHRLAPRVANPATLVAASAAPADPAPRAPASASPTSPAASSSATATAPANASSAAALDGIAAERALLRSASDALAAGHPDEALSALAEHARRFHGGGQLAMEREVAWISALAALGRTRDALERADQFDQSFPRNPRVDELRHALRERAPAH
jgi:RNA polymerase sigma-70 factor (ECF subfamily)